MRKLKNLLLWSCLFILPAILGVLDATNCISWGHSFYKLLDIAVVLFLIWFAGCIFLLCIKKDRWLILDNILKVVSVISVSAVLVVAILYLTAKNYPYTGDFSIHTPILRNKTVMAIVPHQDDDINLVGGIVEPYLENNSEVIVVFTTNGDYEWPAELRAKEVLNALTPLGIRKENIYYLGFGDQWIGQSDENGDYEHIYLGPEPDALWTSHFGATETYGSESIDCYLKLPYTKNNYLHSIKSLILKKRPDVILATDFDNHLDHKGTSLLFEQAMGQLLKEAPDYHPTVYKGFCYGTAWYAPEDFYDDVNLLSSKKPDEETWLGSAYTYRWEDRYRFPVGARNRNHILSQNSVFSSTKAYYIAEAYKRAPGILNGDKVFWERRTDSLLYDAEISVNGQQTHLLNNFQLIDFKRFCFPQDISAESGFCGAVECGQNGTVRIVLPNAVTANQLSLYDHPDPEVNILGGDITFSDGSKIYFSSLETDGSATEISFSARQIQWLEITVTDAEGVSPGLTEIELYFDTDATPESFLMAVDQDDNFVYDYILQDEDTITLDIRQFPDGTLLGADQVEMTFRAEGKNSGYTWENGRLRIRCGKNETCTVTLDKDGMSTTFTVSNPYTIKIRAIELLRKVDQQSIKSEAMLKEVYKIFFGKVQSTLLF